MNRQRLDILIFLGIAFGTFVAGYFTASFAKHPPTESGEWAAWVQAVGSIGAILAAIWVASNGDRKAQVRTAQAKQTLVTTVKYIAIQTLDLLFDLQHTVVTRTDEKNYKASKRRKVAEMHEVIKQFPMDLILSTGMTAEILAIRTGLSDLGQIIEYMDPVVPLAESNRQFKSLENSIKFAHDAIVDRWIS